MGKKKRRKKNRGPFDPYEAVVSTQSTGTSDEASRQYCVAVNQLLGPAPATATADAPTTTATDQPQSTGNTWIVFSKPKKEDEEEDIFHYASEGDLAHVSALLDSGRAAVSDHDDDGRTALLWAADRGHAPVVAELLKRGADVNHQDVDGQTALHYAVSCGHADLVKLLLAVPGIDTSLRDTDGSTALELQPL
eukprot:TRINITY_DN1690_c0_g1_i2.p1 TRINITY_DN1690_c0_g1~~TRINITY_DN1690_c0_g1_i2.p1  ORF type:complete len:193 (+),score=73.50 TRINITY_DN1690_c0_g1_i2:32-610(+)